MAESGEITRLLSRLSEEPAGRADGDRAEVLARLLPLVYSELKMLARQSRYRWQREPRAGTTSLVHEAYAKLVGQDVDYENRRQFFYIASRAMRSILIDNARRFQSQKRGGGLRPVPLEEARLVSTERSGELLELDAALVRLERKKPDLARVVECRTFGGLTVEETAASLSVSPATVKRRWSLATAWLYREMKAAPLA